MSTSVFAIKQKKRSVELDVLRAIAVLLVLGRHLLVIPDSLPTALRTIFLIWREIGWIGVDLFFVLSGFLVSGLLFQEYRRNHSVSLPRFLLRRGGKIYPPFYLLIAVTFLLSPFLPVNDWRQGGLGEMFFLQNYVGRVWNHTWSLAVEEHFYIVLSIVVYLLIRTNKGALNPFKFLPTLILCTAISILILRIIFGMRYPVGNWEVILIFTHFRIDSLLFGVLLSYIHHFHAGVLESIAQRFRILLLTIGFSSILVPLLFPLSQSRFSYTFGFTVLYLSFGAVLISTLFSSSNVQSRIVGITSPLLVPIGRASYSIYLWHMFIYYFSAHIFQGSDSSTYLFAFHVSSYILGSIFFGLLMFRLIEVPCLSIRDKCCSYIELQKGISE